MNILLIEDNPADMRLLKDLFEETQDAPALHWVTDGFEALDYVFQRNEYRYSPRPDAILLDLGLPRVTGYDVLKTFRTDPRFARIPVIILTTSCSPLDRAQCQALGADMFLSKPHSFRECREMVRLLIGEHLPALAGGHAEYREAF